MGFDVVIYWLGDHKPSDVISLGLSSVTCKTVLIVTCLTGYRAIYKDSKQVYG